MMLFLSSWLALAAAGLSTDTPGSSMKLVDETKKISSEAFCAHVWLNGTSSLTNRSQFASPC